MKATEKLNSWLISIGTDVGLALALNQNGICAVKREEGPPLILEADDDDPNLSMISPLVDLSRYSRTERRRLLETSLQMNHVGGLAEIGMLALDEAEDRLLLTWSMPLALLDEPKLAETMDALLRLAQTLKAGYESDFTAEREASAQHPPPEFPPLPGMFA
ncbi:Type III secretion system chaperone [Sulfidibacter corallicola]|uniref:Type III secretion system chaperone n=1 Tax=Sulfidibacter corallicola TaxID=2818388 RepID=A0A8A4TJ66_SULCO|nr:CesT family type III secretion system chaperone [Sulfidibacter corallicola]QTD48891.1 type III secretion system chaperone [Sulfidibacter corallicola]